MVDSSSFMLFWKPVVPVVNLTCWRCEYRSHEGAKYRSKESLPDVVVACHFKILDCIPQDV